MRAFLFLVTVLQLILGGVTFSSSTDGLQESRIIRRAYIDIAGIMPTIEEIDWYVVYNKNGYELAINYLFGKFDTKLLKEYVLSDAYKNQPRRLISIVDINKSIMFLVGRGHSNPYMEESVRMAKQTMIAHALSWGNSIDDTIDYICNCLMSRTSTNQENNNLNRKFKETSSTKGEEQAWMLVFEEILTYDDVRYR